MEQLKSSRRFINWFFNLLIDYLVNSDWMIVVKDFKRSEKRQERSYLGLTDYQARIIYIDKHCGINGVRDSSQILVHELCHFVLGVVLEKTARNLPWKELKNIKGKFRTDKEFEWAELRTREFEKLFYRSLTKKQIGVLQGFVEEAKERHRKEKG